MMETNQTIFSLSHSKMVSRLTSLGEVTGILCMYFADKTELLAEEISKFLDT